MKNKALHELNFKELLVYPADFPVQHYYDPPIDCSGFCTECETSGVLDKAGGRLTLMSHGCDSSDFESILGPMPSATSDITDPILFLLEDPGGDYDFRTPIEHKGITKKVPNRIYYFSPTVAKWPTTFEDVVQNGNYYGTYFAYLMQKHSLANVYITNMVKCKKVPKGNRSLIEEKCISKFLSREIQAFAPKMVFCFGGIAHGLAKGKYPSLVCHNFLYHPHFIEKRSYTQDMTPAEAAAENDRCIVEALKDAGMKVQSQIEKDGPAVRPHLKTF